MTLLYVVLSIILIVAGLISGVKPEELYSSGVNLAQTMHWSVYAYIIVIGCILVFSTLILEQIKSYSLMYLLARTVLEISLLSITMLSCISLYYGWATLQNLWVDFIPLIFIPFGGLFLATVMVQIFDFNYPYKKRVFLTVILALVSFTLVTVHLI